MADGNPNGSKQADSSRDGLSSDDTYFPWPQVSGDAELAQALRLAIAHGANPDRLLRGGCSPLGWSGALGHVQSTQTLLDAGADPTAVDAEGLTASQRIEKIGSDPAGKISLAQHRTLNLLLKAEYAWLERLVLERHLPPNAPSDDGDGDGSAPRSPRL